MFSSFRKRYGRIVLRVTAFLLLLVLVLQGLSWVLIPHTFGRSGGLRDYRARGFYNEQKDSLDVIAIGNSDLYSAFSPMEIWEEHGIASYACGEIKQQVNQALYLLKEVLTCQKPKVVILEVDSLFQESMNGHLASMVKAAVKYVFPVFEYHNRWKEMKIRDLFGVEQKEWRDPEKGYYFSDDVVPYKGGDYMQTAGKKETIDQMTVYYLDEFLSTCEKEGIEVIMVEMPSANSWNMGRHQTVADYAQKHGIPFIDFNINMEETGFDWMTDSRDGGNHLNISGACKISAWLGDYLNENYDLADHRGSQDYAEWQEDLAKYKKKLCVSLENVN